MSTNILEPISIGALHLKNRLYRAPVLEGAGQKKDHAAQYAKYFVPNAQAGVGLIIQGNTIVLPEGRTSLGMTAVEGKETIMELAPMVRAVHEAGAKIVIQLGHGGVYAIESWHQEARARRTHHPYAPSPPPWWLRPMHTGVHALSTDEVWKLIARFGEVAAWTREAGYDAVQLAGGNAKLLHQFLSPVYNRRDDEFGGSAAKRARLYLEIRKAIAERAGDDYPVLLKMPAVENNLVGQGFTLSEGVELARIMEDGGFAAITPTAADVLPNTAICRGSYPTATFTNDNIKGLLRKAKGNGWWDRMMSVSMWMAARKYPFQPVWNREIFRAVKQAVRIPVFAVGGIRTPGEAAQILSSGDADVIGVGRPFYAEPDLPAWFLDPSTPADREPKCESSNACIVPQMLGLPGVCYNPDVNKKDASAKDDKAA